MPLKWRLMLVFFGATSIAWLSVSYFVYLRALGEVNALYDIRLAQSARVLLALTAAGAENRDLERLTQLMTAFVPPPIAWTPGVGAHSALNPADYHGMFAFQVVTPDGSLLLASSTGPDEPLASGLTGFGDRLVDGTQWRVFGVVDLKHGLVLYAGEAQALREGLARHLVQHLLFPALIAVPAFLFLLWVGIRQGLRPLALLAKKLQRCDYMDLSPVAGTRVPEEAQPIVDALNSLFERLERTLERERQFTGNAAHELRTPLAALGVQAQVAQRATDDKQRRRALEQIVVGVGHAAHLVTQLLTLARLDAQDALPEERPADLLQAARRAAAGLESLAGERSVSLKVGGGQDALVPGDAFYIEILLRNLIDNAIRYTPSGGAVSVTVRNLGPFSRVTVEDTGVGIPAGQQDAMFQRFRRGVEDTKVRGSGLGLSIARRICELHGGSIRLETREEGGLRCEVSLPSLDEAAGGTPSADGQRPPPMPEESVATGPHIPSP